MRRVDGDTDGRTERRRVMSESQRRQPHQDHGVGAVVSAPALIPTEWKWDGRNPASSLGLGADEPSRMFFCRYHLVSSAQAGAVPALSQDWWEKSFCLTVPCQVRDKSPRNIRPAFRCRGVLAAASAAARYTLHEKPVAHFRLSPAARVHRVAITSASITASDADSARFGLSFVNAPERIGTPGDHSHVTNWALVPFSTGPQSLCEKATAHGCCSLQPAALRWQS